MTKYFTRYIILVFTVFFFISGKESNAQLLKRRSENDSVKRGSLVVLPALFYLPETRWGFGGFGMYNFHLNKKDSVSSSSLIQLGAAYTQNKQILVYAPYNFVWKEDTWRLNGELGYYKYTYEFFGIGPETDDNVGESYTVDFPRFRFHINKRVSPKFFAGVQYWFEDMSIDQSSFEIEGLLQNNNVAGSEGGRAAGTGLLLTFDTRDHIYYPMDGWLIKGTIHSNSKYTFSEYNFDRYRIDIRNYFTLGKHQTFANQLFIDHITGSPPFTQMAFFGGQKRARGYYTGRYRDKNMVLYQTEYRTKLYKTLGAVAFFDYGIVGEELSNFAMDNGHYSYGVGLRWAPDPKKKVNIRLDAAFGPGTSGYYFTFGEAF